MPTLLGWKGDADVALDKLKILLVGIGSVGATSALSLAHLQVGELRLVDDDCFSETSPLTQPITLAEVGRPKASTIARRCKEISPRTRVRAFDGPLQRLPLADMADVDVALLAGDNATLERELGQRCLNLGVPLVQGSVHGESLTAQCRVLGHRDARGPCLVCHYGAEERQMLEAERVWSCEGFRQPGPTQSARALHPTRSLRPLCALAGEISALQAIRLALQIGQQVEDSLLEISAYTWRTFVTPLLRNPACICQHDRYAIRPTPRPLRDCTLRELLRIAGPAASRTAPPPSLTVDGFQWVERGVCRCRESQPVHRFLSVHDSVASRCARCRKPVQAQPFYTHDFVPLTLLNGALDRPLHALGAGGCRGVLVRRGEKTFLLTNPQPQKRS